MSAASMHPRELYAVEIDRVDQGQWNNIVPKFDDANLMQTWAYGAGRWGEDHLSHILLRRNSEIVSAAQVVTKTVPFLGAGVCLVKGGPVWQLQGRDRDPEILRQILRALREVFVVRRGMLLQIFPAGVEDGTGATQRLFEEEGFILDVTAECQQTALIDLSHPLKDLRNSLRPTWRRNLVLAERNHFTIKRGDSNNLFEAVANLYIQGLRRRGFTAVISLARLKEIQRNSSQRMRVMLCEYQGEPVSGIAVPWLGDTAQAFLSGTADDGLKLRGSYLLQWRMLEWLKESGIRWFDLDGIGRGENTGGAQFKLGFAGRLGVRAERFGCFETSDEGARVAFVRAGLRFRKTYMGMRAALRTDAKTIIH
jgi:peptidoglycan pentaglycine glycine transferase (the first glycine)